MQEKLDKMLMIWFFYCRYDVYVDKKDKDLNSKTIDSSA